MTEKMGSVIREITLNTATFHNVTFRPTLINFFIGKNGTGKTSIGRAIKDGAGLTWSEKPCEVMVYNQDFIDQHFKTLDQLQGIFTLREDDQADQKEKQLTQLREKLEQLQKYQNEIVDRRKGAGERTKQAEAVFRDACLRNTKQLRDKYKKAMAGATRNPQLAAKIEAAQPVEHPQEELDRLYQTVYADDPVAYPLLPVIDRRTMIDEIPSCKLMDEAVVSTATSQFAGFIQQIQALDWVSQGHRRFHTASAPLCPYCQQSLPADFENRLADCFDESYRQAVSEISLFRERYTQFVSSIAERLNTVSETGQPPFISDKLGQILQKRQLLIRILRSNQEAITEKIDFPSDKRPLEDIRPLVKELAELLDQCNALISSHNGTVAELEGNRDHCKEHVWQLLRWRMDGEFGTLKQIREESAALLEDLRKEEEAVKQELADTRKQIASLAQASAGIHAAITGINRILSDTGFEGFEIARCSDDSDAYKVIRKDNNRSIAVRLSEGEKHFLSFLYFYHMVRSCSPDGTIPDRVVVIDDPVSSMDSGSLFIISSLVRQMVQQCHNNADYRGHIASGDHIRQIFILTHNSYFHSMVISGQVRRWCSVNIYKVMKQNNVSSVTICTRPSTTQAGEEENYDPVKSSYAALWETYRTTTDELQLINVMRQILDYYFLHLGGGTGIDLRQKILFQNRDRFILLREDGTEDPRILHVANKLLQYMSAGLPDDLNYICDENDANQYREAFRLIFDCLGQIQHYNMMISSHG